MNSLRCSVRREVRVTFSLRAQSLGFRIAKWTVFVTLVHFYWRQPWFWRCLSVAAMLGLASHLFYRCKTRGWTRPWGGWNDLDTANPR